MNWEVMTLVIKIAGLLSACGGPLLVMDRLKPGRLLIDDVQRNCEEFRLSGGTALLFPRPWNGSRVTPGEFVENIAPLIRAVPKPRQTRAGKRPLDRDRP